jgi:hypothetical protein
MSTITTKDGVEIFYKDWGEGQPIVFSHGWPLSADDWDAQMLFFLNHGYRVIAHDRRGHGRSTQTGNGHDMDRYADDLTAVTAHLDLKTLFTSAIPRAAARWCAIWRGTARAAVSPSVSISATSIPSSEVPLMSPIARIPRPPPPFESPAGPDKPRGLKRE